MEESGDKPPDEEETLDSTGNSKDSRDFVDESRLKLDEQVGLPINPCFLTAA